MSLSKRSIEMLLDLVEIKLSYMDISDREDAQRPAGARALPRGTERALERGVDNNVASFARSLRHTPGRPRMATA
jgi:hypothetical protein